MFMKEINYKRLSYYNTTVAIYKSQNEIRTILQKFGLKGIRFTDLVNYGILEFILSKNNKEMAFRFQYKLSENEKINKQIYRCLFYYLKNRFMAIEFGIKKIEEEFFQELLLKLPDGSTKTIREIVSNQLDNLEYESKLELPFKEKV